MLARRLGKGAINAKNSRFANPRVTQMRSVYGSLPASTGAGRAATFATTWKRGDPTLGSSNGPQRRLLRRLPHTHAPQTPPLPNASFLAKRDPLNG